MTKKKRKPMEKKLEKYKGILKMERSPNLVICSNMG